MYLIGMTTELKREKCMLTQTRCWLQLRGKVGNELKNVIWVTLYVTNNINYISNKSF